MSQPPYPHGPGQPEGGPYHPPQRNPHDQSYGGAGDQYGGQPGQYGGGPGDQYGQSYGAPNQPYGGTGPAYGTPGGGPGAPVGGAPESPKKKSKVGKIVLIVVIALLLVCGGGGTAVYFAVKDDVADVVKAANTTVVAPETLAGRKKSTDRQLTELSDQTAASMKRDVAEATSTVAGFWGDLEKEDLIMVAAASGRVVNQEKQVDDAVRSFGSGGLTVSNVKPVDAGPLGGVAKCGDAKAQGIPIGFCVWADGGSVGLVGIYFKTGDQAKAEFVEIRGAIEQRS